MLGDHLLGNGDRRHTRQTRQAHADRRGVVAVAFVFGARDGHVGQVEGRQVALLLRLADGVCDQPRDVVTNHGCTSSGKEECRMKNSAFCICGLCFHRARFGNLADHQLRCRKPASRAASGYHYRHSACCARIEVVRHLGRARLGQLAVDAAHRNRARRRTGQAGDDRLPRGHECHVGCNVYTMVPCRLCD